MTNAQMIQEMMNNWNKVKAAVIASDPTLTAEEIYQITKQAFENSLNKR